LFTNLISFYSLSIFDRLEDITIILKNWKGLFTLRYVTKNSYTLYLRNFYWYFLKLSNVSLKSFWRQLSIEALLSVLLRGLFFLTERYVVAKRRNNDGISTGFTRKMSKAVVRANRQERDRSWDINRYNGKLSASRNAFFFTIDFAHRRREDREYESNDGARREKCSGLPRAYSETRGKSMKRGRWMVSFVREQCSLFALSFAHPSRQHLIVPITSLFDSH